MKSETAKYENLKANGWTTPYVRASRMARRGPDMVFRRAQTLVGRPSPVGNGQLLGDAKRCQVAKLDISKWKRPSPETIPRTRQKRLVCNMISPPPNTARAKGCSDALVMDYRGYVAEANGAKTSFR